RCLGLRLVFGLWVGLRFGFCAGFAILCLVLLGCAAALEVGGVPAAAFQLKAGCAKQLGIGALAAGRALRQRRLGDLLQVLLLVAAMAAAIFVNRHDRIISLSPEVKMAA